MKIERATEIPDPNHREQEAKVVEIDQVKPLTLVDHCPNCGAKMDLEG